jgi:hypothetical protein
MTIPEEHKGRLNALLSTGAAMDFVSRIHGFRSSLSREALVSYATLSGIGGEYSLLTSFLPALKAADIADFRAEAGQTLIVEEYLGITGTLIEQAARLFRQFLPSVVEVAVLHSVEIASFAPLTEQQHKEQLARRDFPAATIDEAVALTLVSGLNQRVWSAHLNEYVVFNPWVWQRTGLQVAEFLRALPPDERDALLGLSEQATANQGLALRALREPSEGVFGAARRVGLLQSATVKSTASGGKQQTYVFSPANDDADNALLTTESIHRRKLFVAHMLFGSELAASRTGRIQSPTVLVKALLRDGEVGPATAIGTDYHLLEAHGIVRVSPSGITGRSFLELVDSEIVKGGLGWLQNAEGARSGGLEIDLGRAPGGSFSNPEEERVMVQDDSAANEITNAAILKLREEVQRGARRDVPTDRR